MECNKESVTLSVGESTTVIFSYIGDDPNYDIMIGNYESEDPTFDISVSYEGDVIRDNPVTITANGVGYGELVVNLVYYGDDLEVKDTLRLPITITE